MLVRVSILYFFTVALCLAGTAAAASLLPYGTENGDTLAGPATPVTSVSLPESFSFLGETFSTVRVNSNGALQWGFTDQRLIAPFYGDVDVSGGGSVFYRSTTDSSLVQQVSNIVTSNFAGETSVVLSSLLVVTWHHLHANGQPASLNNTFQCVLAYNSSHSYILFLYEDGAVQWTRGANSQPVLVGIKNGESRKLILPTSETEAVLEVTRTSNTGVAGQWLFRVDGTEIQLPAPLVGLEDAQYEVTEDAGSQLICVQLLPGYTLHQPLSLTLTIDGEPLETQVTFPAASGPSRQCVSVDIVDDTVVEHDETMSVALSNSGGEYISILPSSATISVIDDDFVVGWESGEYTVSEDVGSVELCAMLEAAQLAETLTVSLEVGGSTGSDADYTFPYSSIQFQPGTTSRICLDVAITDDSTVENDETLTVTLTSSDDRVIIGTATATITIRDNGDVIYVSPLASSTNELQATERMGDMPICVQVSGTFEREFDLELTLHDGTARAGEHFTDVSGVNSISALIHCFDVPIHDNNIYDIEGTVFSAILSTTDPAVRLNSRTLTVHIEDDDASRFLITFSQERFVGSEDDPSMEVCIKVTRGQLGAGSRVDVNLTTNTLAHVTDRAQAEEKVDFAESERVVTFDSSHTIDSDPECITVAILHDDILEDTETFLMEINKIDKSLKFRLQPFTVICEIVDNDIATATVENTQVTVDENQGARVEVCLLIFDERSIDLDMRASPAAYNATAGVDFIRRPIDFVFYKDSTKACVQVPILNDFLVEALYEMFFVDFSASNPRINFNQSRATVTIRDTDVLIYTVIHGDGLTNVPEPSLCNGANLACITTAGRLGMDITISFYTQDVMAVAGEDYAPFNETRVIRPSDIANINEGLWSYCLDFCTRDDQIVEGNETFHIVVGPHSDRVRPAPNSPDRWSITVIDNDVVRIYPDVTSMVVGEGDGHVSVCANMAGLTERAVNIGLRTTDASAIAGVDYEIINNTIHFPSYLSVYGHLSSEQVDQFAIDPPVAKHCVDVRIIDDNVLERRGSKVFSIEFFSPDESIRDRLQIESGIAITIEDDDQVILSLDEATTVISEGDQRVRVQLALVGTADFEISASISTRSTDGPGAATPEEDYSVVRESKVVLQPGYTTGDPLDVELTVPLRDDSLFEGTETFEVVLSSDSEGVVLGAPFVKTVLIEDNDFVEVGLTDGEFRVLEGDMQARICSYLRGPTEKSVTVNASTSSGTAGPGDYGATPVPAHFTFPPSLEAQQTQCIQYVVIDDDVLEAVETFFVEISTEVPRVNVGRSTTTVSLVDNDGVYVSLVQREVVVQENAAAEGGTGGQIRMCVQMTGIIQTEVEIRLFTEAGTAQADTDFVHAPRDIVFSPSDRINQTHCTTFTFLDDDIPEDTEVFYVNLTTIGALPGTISILTNRAKILMVDSDQVSIDFEHPSYSVTEGEELEVCVGIGALVEKEIVVQFSAVAETAQHYSDFSQVDSQLTFHPRGQLRECTPIIIMDDDLLEDTEKLSVFILFTDPALYVPGRPGVTNSSATVVIGDDDYVTVDLEQSLYVVSESVGHLSVCSILSGTTGKEVSVMLTSQPGTAENGSTDAGRRDYTAPGVSLTFPVSSEEQQRVCADNVVEVVDDERLEDVETFHLEIATTVPRIRIGQSTATVRVEDDDMVEVAMSSPELTVEEGEQVSVCVTRRGVIERMVAVNLSLVPHTAGAGSDFHDEHISIQFSPSSSAEREQCITLRTIQDDIVEITETFFIVLTSTAPYVRLGLNKTVVSINDSDTTTVELEHLSYSVGEAEGTLSVCVVLGAEIEREATVQLTTGDGTARSGPDFTQTDVELTFQSLSSTRLCTSIAITNDNAVEDTEEFKIFLRTADDSLYVTGENGSVIISDDDRVAVSLERGEVSVEEEEGTVEMCVQLLGVVEKNVEVSLALVADTAHAGRDFVPATKTVLFQPALSSFVRNCTDFMILNDTIVEDTESFFVQLTTTGDEQIILERAQARVVIQDSDVVNVTHVQQTQTVRESDDSVSVCVQLSSEVESPVSVKLVTDGDTAHDPRDFTKTYRVLTFEPEGDIQQCVSIAVRDDNVLEENEQFFVYIFDFERTQVTGEEGGVRGFVEVETSGSGGNGGGVEVLSGGVGSVIVIQDDDQVRIGVLQSKYTVEESEPEVVVCLEMEGEMERKVDVSLQTISGTAKPVDDFFDVTKSVTFGPRSATEGECIRIQLIDRPDFEPDERFSVRLLSSLEGSAVLLEPKEATILILDDDVVCRAETTVSPRGEYHWRKTKPAEVKLPCEHSDEGEAIRVCTRNGTWDPPILDDCYGDIDDIFEELDNLPFSCLNFHELLLAVSQATQQKAFEVKYIFIVARFFRDFAQITNKNGYIVQNMTCRGDLDSFSVGVKILDLLFQWPRQVLWTNSTSASILENFEVVSGHVVANPLSADKTISHRNIAFSSSLTEKTDLEKDGNAREFSSNTRGTLMISTELKEEESGSTVLGSIELPESLFIALTDKEEEEENELGVWFSLHKTAHLFSPMDSLSENNSVSTPVISATVGGHSVEGLDEDDPIIITLRLLNQSVTDTSCASWNYTAGVWSKDGCRTVSAKDGYVTCHCYHLTNFAAIGASLVSTAPLAKERPSLALSVVSLVGVMLGLLAIVLTLFALLAFGKLRRRRTTILRAQLCFSLLFLLLAYIGHIIIDYTGTLPQDILAPCAIISTITHYFTLTTLIWMGSEALLMFRKLVLGERLGEELSNIYFVTASTTSWLLPIPFAAIPAVLNRDWIITENQYCFISSVPVFVTTFVMPAAVALIFNLTIYVVVICVFIRFKCKRQPPMTDAPASKKKMKRSRREATVRLIFSSPTIGTLFVLGWLFASLTLVTGEASAAFHLFSALFTAVLGWFIFIYYIATAKDTRKLVYDACCGKPIHNLNANQFLSMESLGKASGIDESDSDSDYPERERRYGEFDVTYVGRKAALIEQKFSVRWGDGEREGNGGGDRDPSSRVEEGNSQSAGGQIVFAAFTPSSTEDGNSKSRPSVTDGDTNMAPLSLEPVSGQPEESKASPDETPLQLGSHSGSQEDVNSDDGSPKASSSRKNFLAPAGQIVFTMTPTT